MINEKKNAKQNELDALYNAAKGKVTSEVDAAIALLDKESATVLKTLDAQVGGEILEGQSHSQRLWHPWKLF